MHFSSLVHRSNSDQGADTNNGIEERRVLTFDLYGCMLNYRLITHFVGQIARENSLSPEIAETFFQIYLERVKYCGQFRSYRDVLTQAMCYVDMELNTTVFSAAVSELVLIHSDLKLHADVLPVLHTLKKHGWELYILANTSMEMTRRVLDHFEGVIDSNSFIFADEVKEYKPNQGFFKFAQDKFRLRRAEHYHVSSNFYTDIVPAINLKWDTIYVNRSKTGNHPDFKPDLIIRSFLDLEEGIKFLNKQREKEFKANQLKLDQARKEEQAELARQEARNAELHRQAMERMNRFVRGEAANNQQQIASGRPEQIQAQAQAQGQAQILKPTQSQERKRSLISRIAGFGTKSSQSETETKAPNVSENGNACPVNLGGAQYVNFVPQTQEEQELAAKMSAMPASKARAVALARERALAHAKLRASLGRS